LIKGTQYSFGMIQIRINDPRQGSLRKLLPFQGSSIIFVIESSLKDTFGSMIMVFIQALHKDTFVDIFVESKNGKFLSWEIWTSKS